MLLNVVGGVQPSPVPTHFPPGVGTGWGAGGGRNKMSTSHGRQDPGQATCFASRALYIWAVGGWELGLVGGDKGSLPCVSLPRSPHWGLNFGCDWGWGGFWASGYRSILLGGQGWEGLENGHPCCIGKARVLFILICVFGGPGSAGGEMRAMVMALAVVSLVE